MNSGARIADLARMLLCCLLIATTAVPLPPSPAGTEPLDGGQKECVSKAIKAIEEFGSQKAGDKEGSAENSARRGAAEMKKALSGRSYSGDLGGDGAGATVPTRTERSTPPGMPPGVAKAGGPETRSLVFDRTLFENCDPCHPDFLKLLDTVMHEGVHVAESSLETFTDDLPGRPADYLNWKLAAVRDEREAYVKERDMKDSLAGSLANLIAEKNDPDHSPRKVADWVRNSWGGCEAGPLKDVLAELTNVHRPSLKKKIDALSVFTTNDGAAKTPQELVGKKPGDPITDADVSGLLDRIDKNDTVRTLIGGLKRAESELILPFHVGIDSATGSVSIGLNDIVVPMSSPQDGLVLLDATNRNWLIIVGHDSTASRGLIHALRLELDPVSGTDEIRVAEARTIPDGQSRLRFVTAIAVTVGGSV